MHYFNIGHAECAGFEIIPSHKENNVQGVPHMFLQNNLDTDRITIWGCQDKVTKKQNRKYEIRAQLQA